MPYNDTSSKRSNKHVAAKQHHLHQVDFSFFPSVVLAPWAYTQRYFVDSNLSVVYSLLSNFRKRMTYRPQVRILI
jgi:hypothetical protein